VEERERTGARDPEAQRSESEEDVEAHRKAFKASEEGSEEGAAEEDVELHRKQTR
jgi:hypothetical protein